MLTGLFRVVSSAMPLVVLIILSRFGVTQDIGLISYFLALLTILGVVTDFGLPETVQRYLPAKTHNQTLFSFILLEFLVVGAAAGLFALADAALGGALSQGYLLLVVICIVASANNVIVMCFNGLQANQKASLYFFITSLVFLITSLSLVILNLTSPVQAFLIGRAVSWSVVGLVALADLFINYIINYQLVLPKSVWVFMFNSFIVAICASIISSWDGVLVQQVLGSQVNAYYRSGMLVGTLPNLLGVIAITYLLPEFSKTTSNIKLRSLLFKFTVAIGLVSLLTVFGGFVLGNWGLQLLFGASIATQAFDFLIGGLVISTFFAISVPSYALLLSKNKQTQVTLLWIMQTVVLIALSFAAVASGLIFLVVLQVVLMAMYSLGVIGLAYRQLYLKTSVQ